MMGVPIDGPSFVWADNMSALHNTTSRESTLKKKSNSIACHFAREAVAMGELLMGHCPSDENLADSMTKVSPGGDRRDALVSRAMHDI